MAKRPAGPDPATEELRLDGAARFLVLLVPFVSGAAIMALELVGMRLLAPRFGASTYVWGGLLGTIMAALALGYLLGGALADRRPRPVWIFGLLLASAAWVGADLLVSERVLDLAERLGSAAGPILATALLLAVPMLLLGSISPFVIRLQARLASLGMTAGWVFAVSTAGSLGGTFAASFWWIPTYGSRDTLRILVVALVALGVAGVAWPGRRPGRGVVAAALAAVPFLAPNPALPPQIVFEAESPYNTVYVQEQDGDRLLLLNNPRRGFHSLRRGWGALTGYYFDALLLGPHLARGPEILVLGMGGGTTSSGYRKFYPGAHVTAVEIDPLIVRVAFEQMGVVAGPDLEVHVADARPFLKRSANRFDFVEVDVFAGGPYAPFYCLTREFFESVRSRLAPRGVMGMNVYAPGGDRTLTGSVVATLARVFPAVYELPLDEESILFAFAAEPGDVAARLAAPDLPAGLRGVARSAGVALRPALAGGGPVFTDDRAPVERLTHRMIARRDRARR